MPLSAQELSPSRHPPREQAQKGDLTEHSKPKGRPKTNQKHGPEGVLFSSKTYMRYKLSCYRLEIEFLFGLPFLRVSIFAIQSSDLA